MILVIGEALIDLIESREAKGQFQAVVGGANANVALALARRGTDHQFLARISSDRFGILIKDRLGSNNVNMDYIINTDEPTTLAVISVNAQGSPTYNFYTNGTADWGWTKQELPTKETVKSLNAKAISFGCLTMAMEPGNLIIEAWAKDLKDDLAISHDINIRAALGFDRNKERERVERVNSFSHIIKASDEDIEWLYDLQPESDLTEIINNWIGNTEKIVLLTRGSQGTRIYRGKETIDVPARKIQVVDTVGAGDTFVANLLGQLEDNNYLGENALTKLESLTNEDLAEYVRISGIAASIACERAGCEPPTLEEVHKNRQQAL
jgi:fructokinase